MPEPRSFPPITERHPDGFEIHAQPGDDLDFSPGEEQLYGGGTVEIGGQTMTQAQFSAARWPLLAPVAEIPILGESPFAELYEPLVQLADDVAVRPAAVAAMVERTYKRDGVPSYSVDIFVAGARAPIIVEGARLAELLERLNV